MRTLQAAVCAVFLGTAAAQAAPARIASFGFEFQYFNGSASTAETARLHMLDGLLSAKLRQEGYRLVGTGPVAAEAKRQDLLDCGTCASDLARKLGANISAVGWVQKVSNLILNVNLVLRDAATGKALRAGSVSIRGNTEQSWRRGLDYLLSESIFPAGKPIPQ